MLYLIILIVILSIYILAFYNIVVNRKNNVEQANSVIDIYLQQRIDLIPNLVQCVKGYKYFEQNTLENIVKFRSRPVNSVAFSVKTRNYAESTSFFRTCV